MAEYDPARDPDVRKTGLGGSDMGVVLGLNNWKDPLTLWMEKTELVPANDVDSDPAWFGRVMEEPIARKAADELGVKLERRRKTISHPEVEWAFTHLDRKIVGERAATEIKTSGYPQDWGEQWTDEIPPVYLAQCHHEMWVCDYNRIIVAVLFRVSAKLAYYEVKRDPEWDALLYERGTTFWNYVVDRTEPPMDFRQSAAIAAWSKALGVDANHHVVFDEHQMAMHETAKALAARAKDCGNAASAIKNELLADMGDASFAALPDGTFYRRSMVNRKGYEVAPATVLDFRHINKLPKGVILNVPLEGALRASLEAPDADT